MNKEEQVPEYQQDAKSVMKHSKEQERVRMAQNADFILSDSLY